jgi:hypothetical protein
MQIGPESLNMKTSPSLPGPHSSADGDVALIGRLLRDYLGRQKLNLAFAIVCMATARP